MWRTYTVIKQVAGVSFVCSFLIELVVIQKQKNHKWNFGDKKA